MVRATSFRGVAILGMLLAVLRIPAWAEDPGHQLDRPRSLDVSSTEPAEEAAVMRALDRPISVDFDQLTLAGLADFLAEHDIDAYLDVRALEEAGMGSDTPVRPLKVNEVSIRSVLDLLLGNRDLTFLIRDGRLQITSTDVASVELVTRIYPVEDLVRWTDESGTQRDDYDTLIELIESVIDPQTWDEVGGPSSIGTFQGTLVVSQTERSHEELAWLLAALRECRDKQLAGNATEMIATDGPAQSAARRRFAEHSQESANFSFEEAPLSDALDSIARQFDVQIVLDLRAIEEAGMGGDTPVTTDLRQVTLPVALTMLLHPYDLTYSLGDEIVLVTTTDAASQMLSVAVYPVADLVQFGDLRVGGGKQDFNALIELIQQQIRPDTWSEVGGPGAIEPSYNTSSLVIQQQDEVHDDVDRLLGGLRRLRVPRAQAHGSADAAPTSPQHANVTFDDQYVSKSYELAASHDPDSVVKQLRASDPYNWQSDDSIRVSGSKIQLHNSRSAVHRAAIRLRQMKAIVSRHPGGMMGGMTTSE
jgi:hypothetical protein